MQELISLKGSCRSRYTSQVCPSFSQKCFLANDFMSQGFVDSLLTHYDSADSQMETFDYSSLNSLIAQAHQAFKAVKQQIDAFEGRFIQKITALYTEDLYIHQNEALHFLKLQIYKCHKKILETSSPDSKLIDDFVMLLRELELTKKRSGATVIEDKASKVLNQIAHIQKELQVALSTATQRYENSDLWRLNQAVILKSKNKVLSKECKTRKLMTLEAILENFYSPASVIRLLNYDYVLFPIRDESSSTQTKMIDANKSKVLFSSKHIYNRIKNYACTPLFLYLDSLDLIISKSKTAEKSFIIQLHKLSSKGMIRRVADISVDSFFPDEQQDEFLRCEVLNPQFLIAIAFARTIKIVNLFTRNVIQTYSHEEDIYFIKYIQTSKLLVIVLSNQLFVYQLSDRIVFSNPKFRVSHNFINWDGFFAAANVVVFENPVSSIIDESDEKIPINPEGYTLKVFQVNQKGVNIYKTVIQNPIRMNTVYTLVNANLNKLKVLYHAGDERKIHIRDIDFDTKEESQEYVDQDILPENNGPFVYNVEKSVYIDYN